jgi:hypothetical protein
MNVTTESSRLSTVRLSPIDELRAKNQLREYKAVEAQTKMDSLWTSLDLPDIPAGRKKTMSVSNIQKFL